MPERPVGVTDTASGAGIAQVRTRERVVGAETVAEQYVIPISERVASYKGMAASFRIAGLATASHNLVTIFNATGSTTLVALRRLTIQIDDTGVSLAVAPVMQGARLAAAPTGGTALTKVPFDTTLTANASVTLLQATTADGAAATAITATAGVRAWSDFKMRAATAVGQFLFPDEGLIPGLCETEPIILRAGEGFLAQMVTASVTTSSYLVNIMWEEFSLP